MREYESSTHLSLSDRVLVYVGFGLILMLTMALYYLNVDGFSRLSLYATVIAFIPTSWVWIAGHYSKKCRRIARRYAEQQVSRRSAPVPEMTRYIYRGKAVPLGEALGRDI